MSSGEIAALITAIGISIAGIITSIAAVTNARYSAARVVDLEEAIEQLTAKVSAAEGRESKARKRVAFLKRLLMQRESENNRLLARDASWQRWGDEVGRLINQLQLEVGALHYQLGRRDDRSVDVTQPLPFVPPPPTEK